MFPTDEFKIRFEIFKKLDKMTFPFSFGEFWRWKLAAENKTSHILSLENIDTAYNKLSVTMQKWQWTRPFGIEKLASGLRRSLTNIQKTYNQLRQYSLLEIEEIPDNLLKDVWHEIGSIKTFGKNSSGYYLVMGATKPLMFLWGQTPAFDSVVRKRMPKFGMTGLTSDYWSFEAWKKVLVKLKENLEQQHGLIEFLRTTSQKEYNTTQIVPYGQFIDLYYWARPCS